VQAFIFDVQICESLQQVSLLLFVTEDLEQSCCQRNSILARSTYTWQSKNSLKIFGQKQLQQQHQQSN